MSSPERLQDTYVGALHHDLVEIPSAATLVGVVRRPPAWFQGTVDENYPALGPPPDLLDEFKERHEALKLQGLCDDGAHNTAWAEIEFEARYRSHLTEAAEAREALTELKRRLRAGEELVFVCFENTAQKRCHRTLLKEQLAAPP